MKTGTWETSSGRCKNRRYKEKTIAYAESHDQAMVGDKTIAFWLMDKEMYTGMSILTPPSPTVERGISIHKLIRLITYGLGGEGYLNFMGNEFGHPEWIDFPREGNGWSHHYARRRWDLAFDTLLRYQHLREFDHGMHELDEKYHFLASKPGFVSLSHESEKLIVFERANLIFVFNFHPTESYSDKRIGVPETGTYTLALCSDLLKYGGSDRVDLKSRYFSEPKPWDAWQNSIQIYIPSRVALVLVPEAKIKE